MAAAAVTANTEPEIGKRAPTRFRPAIRSHLRARLDRLLLIFQEHGSDLELAPMPNSQGIYWLADQTRAANGGAPSSPVPDAFNALSSLQAGADELIEETALRFEDAVANVAPTRIGDVIRARTVLDRCEWAQCFDRVSSAMGYLINHCREHLPAGETLAWHHADDELSEQERKTVSAVRQWYTTSLQLTSLLGPYAGEEEAAPERAPVLGRGWVTYTNRTRLTRKPTAPRHRVRRGRAARPATNSRRQRSSGGDTRAGPQEAADGEGGEPPGLPGRLPLARCRALLGADSPESDEELERVRENLYAVAEVAVDAYIRRDKPSAPPAPTDLEGVADRLTDDARTDIEERAAIQEFDGGLDRDTAERSAVGDYLRRLRE